jgi:hypothetical protein
MIFTLVTLFFFNKDEPGTLPTKSLYNDKDSNVIGKVLGIIEMH